MEYHGLVVNKQDTFLTVLESEESKSNVPVDSRSGESSLLISWWLSFHVRSKLLRTIQKEEELTFIF